MILAPVVALLLTTAPSGCTLGGALKEGQQHGLQRTTMRHIESLRAMEGVKPKADLVCGKFARVKLTPPAGKADPGYVILRKAADGWRVVLGPATTFSAEDLKKAGAPSTIWPPR